MFMRGMGSSPRILLAGGRISLSALFAIRVHASQMRVVAALLSLTALCFATLAMAQDDNQGPICVGGAHWQATLEETRRIEDEPVPESFRVPFETVGGCQRWGLNVDGLVAWHLRFGSAATVTAALRYLEADYARRIGRLSRFDILTVTKAEQLDEVADDIDFIAEQFLSAAEEFEDPELLAKADGYVALLTKTVAFAKGREPNDPLVRTILRKFETPNLDDFTMRIAVLKAVISNDDADVWEARQLLERLEPLEADRAAMQAYSGGPDFCDISDGWGGSEKVQAACASDDQYDVRVTTYFANLARLELLADSEYPNSYRRALELLDDRGDSYCCRRGVSDRLYHLRLAEAGWYWRMRSEPDTGWGPLLQALEAAEKFTPPYESPARFRRVATQWLSAWEQVKANLPNRSYRTRVEYYTAETRYESYLRSTLANLDAITVGEIR
jgi:hypothetical protein